MRDRCGMDAFDAADYITLPVFIKQHAAIETKPICGGADFHGEIAPAGNALALDVEGCFTRVGFKELCQTFNIQHCFDTVFQQVVPALRDGFVRAPLYKIFVEAGEADGPYSLPSQPSCREGGAKEAEQSAQNYSILWSYKVNAGKPTPYCIVEIHIMNERTVPWPGMNCGQRDHWRHF